VNRSEEKEKKSMDTFLEYERNGGCEKKKQRWANGVHKIIVGVSAEKVVKVG